MRHAFPAGLLLLRDDKDFQSWDSGTQTLCDPYTADIPSLYGDRMCRLENARFWRKIMKMDPKQVHMAPFGLIFIQDGSHKLWEASGMPPGP